MNPNSDDLSYVTNVTNPLFLGIMCSGYDILMKTMLKLHYNLNRLPIVYFSISCFVSCYRKVNYMAAWLSVVGPAVGLDVPLSYHTALTAPD